MLRKPTAILMTLGAIAAAVASIAPASAVAAQRIDMKVLVLGTTASEPNFVSWQAALQREGVPFEAVATSPTHTPITAATLSTTLANGTQEAKYQAIIVSVGGLNKCPGAGETGECTPTLTQSEWTALEEYEQTFNVRQITGDVFPNATYGLGEAKFTGEFAAGAEGTLSAEGKTVFPYLNGPVTMDTGTYGYEAPPATTQVAGASFSSLLTGPNGTLVGVYTHPNGVQEMVETFDENASQLQAELLRHGALNWVTRGVYFGDQRNYVEMDIDDTFTPDDAWNTATHEINYDNADSLRIQPADVEYAAKWSKEHNFRMEQLFNGGGSVEYQEDHGGVDPVLAKFQAEDPETKKSYADSFGWLSHTYDTPYMDVGCATQRYIEAQLNENTNWAAGAPGATAGTGGLGLTETTELADALGTENPHVFVPGNHSGFADLVPGNPATVDAPEFDADEKTEEGKGTLSAGSYEYAITDQFVEGGGQSAADVTPALAVGANGSVTLEWESICHAAVYLIYREVADSGKWSLIGTVKTPFSATLPDNSVGEAESTTNVKGGGELEQTFIDTGIAGTEEPSGWTPPITEDAVEAPWEQNPYFIPALEGVGVTAVGADASKAYPDPPETQFGIGTSYTGPEFAAGETFLEGTSAQVVPRHPINIYYNASTEAQEVDEWNTLFEPPPAGQCENTATTTCETAPATFAEIVKSVVSGMFQNMMGNDPRPSYVHQTNIMGQPPAGEPTNTTTLPTTPEKTGDGLLYSVLNPLLAEYNKYFASTVPYEQLTLGAIANVLAEQQAWSKANAAQVSGYIEGNQVTVDNTGASAVNTPLTGVTSVGSSYGGIQSGWTSAAAGMSTYTAATSWPTAPEPVQKEPQGSWVGKVGSAGYLLADWDGVQDVSNMPGVTASLVQGSRHEWAANTTEVRAMEGPEGTTRDASAYYDPNEIKLQLGFTNAYSGNLHLYAVDWDSTARRETITINDGSGPRSVLLNSEFNQGAWVSLPIDVAAEGTVSIAVQRNAGANAVLSGVFLGEAGAPPANVGTPGEGGWVGAVGSAGYDLAGWDGPTGDVSYLPNASLSLVHGTRYQWAAKTTDGRALSEPGQLTRNASAYYDPNQIQVKLSFTAAYSGNLHLYAVDWTSTERRETISVNGQSAVLSSSFNKGVWVTFPISVAAGGTVTITVDRTAGVNAVLSGIFLGEAGAPPGPTVASAPQGTWVGAVGSAGYDLAGWDGSTGDVSNLPNASLSLLKGSRYQWTANTAETRALSDPTGAVRNAGAYYDPNEIQLKLSFTAAYSGTLHLYAVDWDKQTRREIITVNGQSVALGEFNEGAWVAFPISVVAGGTVTITVDHTFGPNAVLSGIFLGEAGAPAAAPVSTAPQGSWVGTYGSTGYDLLGFNGSTDLASLPNVTESLERGSRYVWASSTTDVRALENAEKTTRVASTYYNSTQVLVKLTFTVAYSGPLELYALDWDSTVRREIISVNGQSAVLSSSFKEGAWMSFPINVAAGGTVTITVDRIAGANAVLSGLFLN